MKKILISMFLFIVCLCLVGCDANNNSKKLTTEVLYDDWYNCSKLPNIADPFAEAYDGSYTIKIDKENRFTFTTFNGEQLKGKLELEEDEYTVHIKMKFENNDVANGYLNIKDESPSLVFFYKGVNYRFTDSRSISKDEFEAYRADFCSFLRNSFINNSYPSIEEAETSPLYREYTNFSQIDPCCNGPKVYTSANRVTIANDPEKGEIYATYNDGSIDYIDKNDIEKIVLVKADGTLERLEKIQDGQCFLTNDFYDHSLYYFEIGNSDIKINMTHLQEAYENNKISKEQLQEIANIFNEHQAPNQNIDDSHLLAIKEKVLENLWKNYEDATLDDIFVDIYWSHGTNYIITIIYAFTKYPAVDEEITIDGITITYSGPKPMFVEIINE